MSRSVLVLDCGATNVRACLVNESGKILSCFSEPNITSPDPEFPGGMIWDINEIFRKFTGCIRKLNLDQTQIIAVTATSFGVDGALMKNDGTILYPVISWQCSRTRESENHIDDYFDRDELFAESGLQSYHFNTINKLIWLKENRPGLLHGNARFVLMPSLIIWWLCGELVTDTTMAGTTMLTTLSDRTFSVNILRKLQLHADIFPKLTEPGTVVGKLSGKLSQELNLPAGIPVIVAGHDTQFALVGAGAGVYEPVLSSGTWEVIMNRIPVSDIRIPGRKDGITIEMDAVAGIANPGLQWVASGVMEWLSKIIYSDLDVTTKYSTIIGEAGKINPGADGLIFIPEIFPGGFSRHSGTLEGLNHNTSKAHIYRSAIESLCFYLRYALEKLNSVTQANPKRIICVGGGSRNNLWNQIRASVLGIPVSVPDISEATATGAALFAFTGTGVYHSVSEASGAMLNPNSCEYLPGPDQQVYTDLYHQFLNRVF